MTPLSYVKYGAIAAVLIAYSWMWFFLGGRANKTELETFKESQESALVAGLRQQLTNAQNESTRRQGVIDVYDKAKADADLSPIAVGVGKRVLIYAASTCSDPVPKASGTASGTIEPARSSGGAEEFERLFDELGKAIGHDNAKIIALQDITKGKE